MSKPPIIFDFTKRTVRRGGTTIPTDIVGVLLNKVRKPRIAKTVEGIPPHNLPQPKK